VDPKVALTESVAALVMLASVYVLPQFFNHNGAGIGLGA
jgi:hypothetical protein